MIISQNITYFLIYLSQLLVFLQVRTIFWYTFSMFSHTHTHKQTNDIETLNIIIFHMSTRIAYLSSYLFKQK
jgi:hypothetical protein